MHWDVLLTDRARELGELEAARMGVHIPRDVGVVMWNDAASDDEAKPPDARLPADADAALVALACRLVAKSVRLRRRLKGVRRERDIHERRADRDPLTGLANRRAWERELKSRMRRLQRGGQSLCLVLVDLDHFKPVNDNWGHAAGDEVLRRSARALRAAVRSTDFVARLGGDEFGVLLDCVTRENLHAAVDRLRNSMAATLTDEPLHVITASAGVALLETGQHDARSLVAAADAMLLAAKRQGRNCTRFVTLGSDMNKPQ